MFFEARYRVRFHDVDHAGIIFFARIQQYCHDAMEDMQRDAGITLETFIETRAIGAPLVDVHARYLRPYRHGEVLCIRVGIERIGTSSITTRFDCFDEAGEQLCARVRFVQCVIGLDDFAARPVPDDIRQALSRFAVEALAD